MSRIPKIIRTDAISQDTWTKIFDWSDYDKLRIAEIKVKPSENTTMDHFRYNYDGDTSDYATSTAGFSVPLNAKQVWVYVPDVDSQVMEIEIIYK